MWILVLAVQMAAVFSSRLFTPVAIGALTCVCFRGRLQCLMAGCTAAVNSDSYSKYTCTEHKEFFITWHAVLWGLAFNETHGKLNIWTLYEYACLEHKHTETVYHLGINSSSIPIWWQSSYPHPHPPTPPCPHYPPRVSVVQGLTIHVLISGSGDSLFSMACAAAAFFWKQIQYYNQALINSSFCPFII